MLSSGGNVRARMKSAFLKCSPTNIIEGNVTQGFNKVRVHNYSREKMHNGAMK